MSAVQRSQIEKFIHKVREETQRKRARLARKKWEVHENINKLKATDRVKDQPQVYTNNPKDTQVHEELEL